MVYKGVIMINCATEWNLCILFTYLFIYLFIFFFLTWKHKILNVQKLKFMCAVGCSSGVVSSLGIFVCCTKSASSAAALSCGSGDIFLAKTPYLGLKLKADSNRESFMILKMRREEILFTYGTEGRKKTLNLTDIKRPFGQRDAFWAAARWLYNERLESGIFGNLWRGHDIWWTPCISLNKANMIQGRTQDLLGFAGKTLVLWER